MWKIDKFDREARTLKHVTLSNWSAWRYSPNNSSTMLTFNKMKSYMKKHNVNYITIYFKDSYWGNISFF